MLMKIYVVTFITLCFILSGCSANIQTSREQQKPSENTEAVDSKGISAAQFSKIKEGMTYQSLTTEVASL